MITSPELCIMLSSQPVTEQLFVDTECSILQISLMDCFGQTLFKVLQVKKLLSSSLDLFVLYSTFLKGCPHSTFG